jgi:hypothetical protein
LDKSNNFKAKPLAILSTAILGSMLAIAAISTSITAAFANDCSTDKCVAEGRMTGGGRLDTSQIVTHGFELHCNINHQPNNLEINWFDSNGNENHFKLDGLYDAICVDSAEIPNPPAAPFDVYEAHGFGKYNGVDGARIYFVLVDAGEPGTKDSARFKITNADHEVVLDVGTGQGVLLDQGNHQAHKENLK